MGKIEKSSGCISVIGGSDGPTSVFLAGKKKKSLKQRVHKRIFEMRKKRYARGIKPGTHTMDEVMNYLTEQYGMTQMSKDSKTYQMQYDNLKMSFIMQHAPELLGEYAKPPTLKSRDEAGIREFQKQLEIREQKAKEIPDDVFPLDYHIFIREDGEVRMEFDVEARFGHIGGGYSGPGKRGKRKFSSMYKDIFRYYGVSEEDIAQKTRRYTHLLTALAMRD